MENKLIHWLHLKTEPVGIYKAKQQSTTSIGRGSAPHGGGGSNEFSTVP